MTAVHLLGPVDATRNILVLGDGFDDSSMSVFRDACVGLCAAIERSPWYRRAPKLGVWRLDVVSASTDPVLGFPNPPCVSPPPAPLPHVKFGARYGDLGNARMISGTEFLVNDELYALASPVVMPAGFTGFDHALVVVNYPAYGGACGTSVAWASLAEGLLPALAIHELGHTFALNDEYEGPCGKADTGVFYPTKDRNIAANPMDTEWQPWQALGFDSLLVNKAADATACDVKSPYPATIVGAFEGGNLRHTGHYRPSQRCRMRDLQDEFCPICEMAIANELDGTLPDAFS